MAWSGFLAPRPLSLAPRFVSHDYVTAELTHSTARVCHRAHFIMAALCCRPVRAHLKSSGIPAGSATRSEERVSLLLRLLCQPGGKKRLCSSHGSLSFPAASWLAPCLPWVQRTLCTRYSKDNWGHEQDQLYTSLPSFTFFLFLHFIQFCDPEPVGTLAAFLTFSLLIQRWSPSHPDSGIHPLRSLSLTLLVETIHLSQPGYSFQLVLYPEVLRTCVSTVSNPLFLPLDLE